MFTTIVAFVIELAEIAYSFAVSAFDLVIRLLVLTIDAPIAAFATLVT